MVRKFLWRLHSSHEMDYVLMMSMDSTATQITYYMTLAPDWNYDLLNL